jgi:hypothetical protein
MCKFELGYVGLFGFCRISCRIGYFFFKKNEEVSTTELRGNILNFKVIGFVRWFGVG